MGLTELIFGDSSKHPLELDKSDHRDKQVELNQKRDELTSKKEKLQARHDELKQQYMDAREAGEEDRAEAALRQAEEVDSRLETVEGKLDVVDRMSQTVSNFINVYEMRELRDDQYWERLMELSREELVEAFSQEEMSIEEMTQRLDTAGVAADDVVDTFSQSTDRLHGGSELRDEWESEFQDQSDSSSVTDPSEVFDDLESNSEDEDYSDLQLT